MLHLGGGLFTCAKGVYYGRGSKDCTLNGSFPHLYIAHDTLQDSYEPNRAAEISLSRLYFVARHRSALRVL